MEIPFVGQSYTLRSTDLSAQRTVNWYPEMGPDGVIALLPRPGLVDYVQAGSGPIRGGHEFAGVGYVVSGNKFYSVSGGVATERGTLNTSTGRVYMAFNGVQVMITDGSAGYIYTLSGNTFAEITDADYVYYGPVTYINSYFIASDPGTGVLGQSDVFDGTAWAALDFANAESSPDDVVHVIADHDELLVFGGNTVEFWYNDAGTGFSFSRYIGAQIETGLGAAASVAKLDQGVFFLGDDGLVYRIQGRQPVRISTHAIEFALQSYASVADAYAFTLEWDGHKFYCLTSDNWDTTWAFDIATGSWVEFSTFGVGRWDVGCCFKLGRDWIVGASDGQLSTLDGDTYTDNGGIIERLRTTRSFSNDRKLLFCHRLELHMEAGAAPLGLDPTVMLSWSDDGGHTYGNEIYAGLGLTGEYGWRVYWNRLGATRDRIWRLRITDPVKAVLLNASVSFSTGSY